MLSLQPRRLAHTITLCLTLLALVFCTACAVQDAQLSVAGPVEYTLDPIVTSEVITCDQEDVKLAFHDDIVGSRVGTQSIEVELSQGPIRRTESVEVTVSDTQAPTITLAEPLITLEMGTPFEPASNIVAVEDPVDGSIGLVESKPTAIGSSVGLEQCYDEGWCLISGSFDQDRAGSYPFTVTACDQHGNETSETFTIEVIDPLEGVKLNKTTTELEYGKGTQDPRELVTCSVTDATIEAEPFSLSEIGSHKVTFTLSKGASTRELVRTFKVIDTKAPTLELKKERVRVEMGTAFKPESNVATASDPVDGSLSYVAKRPKALQKGRTTKAGQRAFYDQGWYTVLGDLDLKTPGTYTLTVLACDKHANETEMTYTVRVTDPLKGVKLNKTTSVLEYADQELDPVKLVKCSDGEATVSAAPINLREVGTHKVEYAVSKGASTHSFVRTFKVRDTKSPVIGIAADECTINAGDSFDPYANIASVTDPVDGDLPRYDSEPGDNGDGWYTIGGSYDVNTPGRYFFTVTACDRNGNRTTKRFSLYVQAVQVQEPVDNGRDYVLNTSTHKFHYPSCWSLPTTNRQDVHMTREEIIAMGYTPCGNCHP